MDPSLDRAKGRPFAPPQVETLNSPQVDSVMGLLTAQFAEVLFERCCDDAPCALLVHARACICAGGSSALDVVGGGRRGALCAGPEL